MPGKRKTELQSKEVLDAIYGSKSDLPGQSATKKYHIINLWIGKEHTEIAAKETLDAIKKALTQHSLSNYHDNFKHKKLGVNNHHICFVSEANEFEALRAEIRRITGRNQKKAKPNESAAAGGGDSVAADDKSQSTQNSASDELLAHLIHNSSKQVTKEGKAYNFVSFGACGEDDGYCAALDEKRKNFLVTKGHAANLLKKIKTAITRFSDDKELAKKITGYFTIIQEGTNDWRIYLPSENYREVIDHVKALVKAKELSAAGADSSDDDETHTISAAKSKSATGAGNGSGSGSATCDAKAASTKPKPRTTFTAASAAAVVDVKKTPAKAKSSSVVQTIAVPLPPKPQALPAQQKSKASAAADNGSSAASASAAAVSNAILAPNAGLAGHPQMLFSVAQQTATFKNIPPAVFDHLFTFASSKGFTLLPLETTGTGLAGAASAPAATTAHLAAPTGPGK